MDRLEGEVIRKTLSYDAYIRQVEERIIAACERSGRAREDVRVIAVTKYIDTEQTKDLMQAGLRHLGENRWQNAKEKWEAIGGQAVWHFIGHLQTNKVKDVVGRFAYIHSVDRGSLLQAIQARAERLDIRVPIFLQVNVSGEESKYGLDPQHLFAFAEEAAACRNIEVIGLMTMAPFEEEPERTRPVFRGLREMRDQLNGRGLFTEPIQHLSMGMSADFEIAIEEGATWLRLGSVLIGR